VRRIVGLAAIATALTACGAGAGARGPIMFGITGGNLAPYGVTIQPTGTIEIRASVGDHPRRQLSPARVRQLADEIQQAHLASRTCSGVLPDVASRYIRIGGHTVTVHGSCEPGFRRVWSDLARAVSFG
jgi:hypothetical protein